MRYAKRLVLAVALCPVVAWAVPVLDQASDTGTSLGTLGQPDNAQTFTVGTGGLLTEIQVEVRKNSTLAGDLDIDLRDGTGGTPDNDDSADLAATTVAASSLAFGAETWVSFDLRPFGIFVRPGDQLAIAMSVATTSPAQYFWMSSGADPYAGGQRFSRSPIWAGGVLGSSWNGAFAAFATTDMNFRVFVDSAGSSVPEPSSVLLAALGILSLVLGRRQGS